MIISLAKHFGVFFNLFEKVTITSWSTFMPPFPRYSFHKYCIFTKYCEHIKFPFNYKQLHAKTRCCVNNWSGNRKICKLCLKMNLWLLLVTFGEGDKLLPISFSTLYTFLQQLILQIQTTISCYLTMSEGHYWTAR